MPAAASDMVNPSAWLLVNTSAPSPGAPGRPLADRTHMRGSRRETVSRSEAVAGNQRTGASNADEEQPVDLSRRAGSGAGQGWQERKRGAFTCGLSGCSAAGRLSRILRAPPAGVALAGDVGAPGRAEWAGRAGRGWSSGLVLGGGSGPVGTGVGRDDAPETVAAGAAARGGTVGGGRDARRWGGPGPLGGEEASGSGSARGRGGQGGAPGSPKGGEGGGGVV